MIERKIVAQKMKEFQIEKFISSSLNNTGYSHTKVQRTPLGEKVLIHASRPGLIVGRKGQNIKKLTSALKKKFGLENPQIEIAEVENVHLDAKIIAERIASSLERFGSARFKGIVHKVMADVMSSEAHGVEIIISGKVPSQRAKSWRFYAGYLKKCGDIAISGVDVAYAAAKLKSGIVGIKVRIMPKSTKLPDDITIPEEIDIQEESVEEKPKKSAKKRPAKNKKATKKKAESKPKAEIKPKEEPKVEEKAEAQAKDKPEVKDVKEN